MNRRRFLRGLGGVAVTLPWLETFAGRSEAHAAGDVPPFLVIMRQANGVQQLDGAEPENFWPTALGAITSTTLGTRAVSELSAYASKLLIVRGVNYSSTHPNSGCEHSTGGNICLTATDPTSGGPRSLATGESLDNRIARELTPGVEPLTLYAGPKEGYINEVLSYRGSQLLRAAEGNPYNAYQRLFGMSGGTTDPIAQRQALARKSVNDLVRERMQALLARTDLSSSDRQRLDLHFSSIRDVEVAMSCTLPATRVSEMQSLSSQVRNNSVRETIVRMQMDIIALAMACRVVRVATLQVGDGNDGSQLTVEGSTLPRYHQISHRIFGDGSDGAPIPEAVLLHHKVDRWHARQFKYLLDKLSAYTTSTGTLLDSGTAVWLNDLATGSHRKTNMPYVIAGSAGGQLKTGVYVDAGGVTHNRMLNTLGAAMGVKNGSGLPLDDFGKAGLTKGRISQMLV